MNINWAEYFERERQIKRLALSAGIPAPRAAAIAEAIASRPVRKPTALAGRDDPQVVAALRLLGDLGEPAPSIDTISVAPLVSAWALCRRGAIIVDPRSPFYRNAGEGRLLGLALLLHHENHHLVHGGEEEDAYQASEDFVHRHGSDPELLEAVEAGRDYERKKDGELSHIFPLTPAHGARLLLRYLKENRK